MEEKVVVSARDRAEARRRRILQGGAARLAAIAGRDLTAEERAATSAPVVPAEDSVDDAFLGRPFEIQREEPVEERTAPVRRDTHIGAPHPPSFWSEVVSTRMHIPVCAIVAHLIYAVGRVDQSYLFLPLLLWELVEFFYVSAQEEKSQSLALTAITGVAPEVIEVALKITKRLSSVIKDACIYTFTTVALRLAIDSIAR